MSFDIKQAEMTELARFRDDLRKHPKLIYLFFELTDQCNLNCMHCGSNCSVHGGTYLPLTNIVSVLDMVKQRYGAKRVMICLTGGEPLLHPQFDQIVCAIWERGFPWGITTNGTLITERTIALFRKCNLASVTLSLDGLEAFHDAFRRRKGSYRRTLEVAKLLMKHGIPVQITTVVSKQNIASMDELYHILATHHIPAWRLVNIEPIGRAKEHPELLLGKSDFCRLFDFIREKRYNRHISMRVEFGCSHYLTFAYEKELRDYYFICGSGIYVASILCNGDIYSCLDIERRPELVQGNIFRDSFIDVWENRFRVFREDRTKRCRMCRECGDRLVCGGDSTHTWDFDKQCPSLCIKQILSKDDRL